jgi:hypothetical protein
MSTFRTKKYDDNILKGNDNSFKINYGVLNKVLQAKGNDLAILDAEITYWENMKTKIKGQKGAKKQTANINKHIKNVKAIKKAQDMNIQLEGPSGDDDIFKTKTAPASAPTSAPKPAPKPASTTKAPKPASTTKAPPTTAPKPASTTQAPTTTTAPKKSETKQSKPPKVPPKPASKPFAKVPDSLNPLHDDLINDVPQTLGKIRNEIKTSTKTQLGIFIKTMRKNSGIEGYMKGNLGTMKKQDLQNLILNNLDNYVRNLEGVPRTLEELQTESFIEGERAKVGGMTEAEAQLMYGSKEEFDKYLKGKTKEEAEGRITDYLLQHDPRKDQGRYKGLKITPESHPNLNIQKAFQDILANQVYIDRTKNAIIELKKDEHFRASPPNIKVSKVNNAISHKITPEDFNNALRNPEIFNFVKEVIQDVSGEDVEPDIQACHKLIRDLGKINNQQDIDDIRTDLYDFSEIIQEEQQALFDEYIQPNVNTPADVRVLPKGVKVKAIKEEMESDLDRYTQATKELAPLLKIKEADRTAEQTADIERLQRQREQYEPKAKELLKQKKDSISKRTTATKRTGQVRPHFINPTEKNVKNAIGETAEQQIKDIKNWWLFDNPEYSTGVGNRLENPLVQQNADREKMLVANTDIYTAYDSFLVNEGIEERKDFYYQHSNLSKDGIERGLKQHYYEETEEQFLQKFNSGSNGLFSQDQTKEEVSDFQNIYQIPQGHIDNKHPPQFTNNRGITHNDKTWIDNLNIFYKGATIN